MFLAEISREFLWPCVNPKFLRHMDAAAKLTFVAVIVLQPFGGKGPRIETRLVAIDDERLAALDDMKMDELFEFFEVVHIDHIARDAVDILEAGCALDELVKIKVRWNGLERRAWSLRRHPVITGNMRRVRLS